MGRSLNTEEKVAFAAILKEIELRHKDFFEERHDSITNHISYTINEYCCYLEWKPNSNLSPKIRHEISKAFHSINGE